MATKKVNKNEDLLSTKQAASHLNLSESTVRRYLNDLPHIRIGPNKLMFSKKSLDQWLSEKLKHKGE